MDGLCVDNLLKHHVGFSISLYKEHTEFYPQTGNANPIHQRKIPLLVKQTYYY